ELHGDIPIEVVPGVSSITAAAARVRWSLAQRDEPLLIVPGSYHVAHLSAWLSEFPAICLMKPAKVLPQLVETLHGRGAAVYVEGATTLSEWLTHDLTEARGRQNYFSLVLLRTKNEQRDLLTQPFHETGENPSLAFRAKTSQVRVVGIGPGDLSLLTP